MTDMRQPGDNNLFRALDDLEQMNAKDLDAFWTTNEEVNEQQNEIDAEREHDAMYSRAYLEIVSAPDMQVDPAVMAEWLGDPEVEQEVEL